MEEEKLYYVFNKTDGQYEQISIPFATEEEAKIFIGYAISSWMNMTVFKKIN